MIITLTTDFGMSDGYVGAVKGVLLSGCPEARIIDIAHDLPPQDITAAMMVLLASIPYFPDDTIHLAVIDPGVGSSRRGIAVRSSGRYFVGPDNGIFTPYLENADMVVELPRPGNTKQYSPTFDGRDVFAPAAAAIASGTAINELGEEIDDPVLTPIIEPMKEGDRLIAKITYIDRFGNCFTNIHKADIDGYRVKGVEVGGEKITWLALYFAEAAPGDALALMNSSGFLEIAVNKGNAAKKLAISVGDVVTITLEKRE